ncbi:ribonuclease P protein component [Pleomorphomonas koreensis]|uniref:ribonuclease P protein component n=1 Tax=Pleomorphomonas koreensis TaxID=257440 RepID=UPI000413932A|nr:ribonuclease P protein component [Pleomorphomonas koreensis]
MQRLKKRNDYVKVARGARTPRRGFLLQSIRRPDAADNGAEAEARFGFTVTKKMGNAVVRNRIRRRLKEAVRLAGAAAADPERDFVLVGRRPALDMPFSDLVSDVVGAVRAAASVKTGPRGGKGAPKPAPSEEETGP